MSLTRVRYTLRGGTLRGGTLGGGGGKLVVGWGVSWWWGGGGGLLDVGYVEGVRWGGGGGVVRWRGGGGDGGWESGTSTREDRSKTAQILLEKPFKNHRKK